MKPRRCRTCRELKPANAYCDKNARRCEACREEYKDTRTYRLYSICRHCGELKSRSAYPGRGKAVCTECRERPTRVCVHCRHDRPVAEFGRRERICRACRPSAGPPPRACFRCHEIKPADAFPWSEGGRGTGKVKRRRSICTECLLTEAAERHERAQARRATWERKGRLVRRCSTCHQVKDLETEFYTNSRGCDGTLSRHYECKACSTERSTERHRRRVQDARTRDETRAQRAAWARAWRARNPERAARVRRVYMERLKADPSRYAKFLESTRIAYRLRVEKRTGRHVSEIRGLTVKLPGRSDDMPRLPSRPLIDMIERVIAAETVGGDPHARERVCQRAGIDTRNLYAWRCGERQMVQFDVADRVLTGLGLMWLDVWKSGEDYAAAARAFEGVEAVAA